VPGRVLIVSPHFPPVNAPDHQRVRMALPYLAEFGWQAHVLAVDPEDVEGFRDPDLLATIPPEVPVTRVRAIPFRRTRRLGLGSLGLRSRRSLRRAGDRLLAAGGFDLVYCSTTIFSAMTLGPRWKRCFRVPYVLDFQDPWVSDYYSRTGIRPPGGRLKYGLVQWLARREEPRAVRGAAHIVCVSPSYPDMLRARYPDVPAERFTVLPFGASERDMELAQARGMRTPAFDPGDGKVHWVYLGRGGADMARGLRALFSGLRALRESDPRVSRLRLHFVGTSYAAGDRAEKTVEPLAREMGVGDLVEERPARIPYLDGLALMRASDAVLVVGSDDPGYSASKVYPCVLARRPVLAVLHAGSLPGRVLDCCQAGEVVEFTPEHPPEDLAGRVREALARLLDQPKGARVATDWAAFAAYTARETTRRQCEVFDRAATRGSA
jgi:hypothetical protein